MTHKRRPYFKQKVALYFDENFPVEIIDVLKLNKRWAKKLKLKSVFDYGYDKKDDAFHFGFCRKNGFTLVTLDEDFWNDHDYPFNEIPGVIIVKATKTDIKKITISLLTFLDFMVDFPRPRVFIGDSKFKVSPEGVVMKGRDATTRAIKTMEISPGVSMLKVARYFGYVN